MTRNHRIALAVLAVTLTGGLVYLMSVPRVIATSFVADVETDLPTGTPMGDVEAWLRNRGIQFGHLRSVIGENRRRYLDGEIDVYHLELSRTVIQFEFTFDDDGKLDGFTADRFVHGFWERVNF